MTSRSKYSVESNIALIKEIEKHRCLYDWNLETYTDRHAQLAAWRLIAAKLNLDAEDCKFRWKNFRGGLTRYLKNLERKGPHDPTLTKYYLHDSMQFLVEFTRAEKITKTKRNNAINKSLAKTNDVSEDSESSENSVYMEELNLDNDHEILKQPQDPTVDPLAVGVVGRNTSNENDSNNHDLDFFKSILPDIADFTSSQKRKFKQKVLKVIEKISREKRRYQPY